jgi:putative ABC transport system substrate-binding protein
VLGEVNPIAWTVATSVAHIECRFAGDGRRLIALAAELAAREVDVLVTLGAKATRAAMYATRSVPIVFVAETDPASFGPLSALARAAGNVTGLAAPLAADRAREALSALRQAAPGLRRVGVLSCPDSAGEGTPGVVWPIAGSAPVEVWPITVRGADDAETALGGPGRGADGLLVLPDVTFAIPAARLVELVAARRMPAVYGARAFVEAGGLMAVYADTAELIRRAVALVARVLAGERPAAIAVESLAGPRIAVNPGVARALGLRLPGPLLARAEAVTPA